MPTATVSGPEIASPFTSRPRVESRDPAAAPPAPPRSPVLAIALGALSVLLLVIIFALWSRVGSRDDTISQIKNRSDQLQVDTIQLQSQVAEDKVARGVLQKHMDDAQAASISDKADSDKANAASVELQRTLDKTRIIATDFQSQMENAKVASIKLADLRGRFEASEAMVAQLEKAKAKD